MRPTSFWFWSAAWNGRHPEVPARVFRGDLNRSMSLSRVSLQADLTFRALISAVDDYGRLSAEPDLLKADLFPCRASVSPHEVESWVAELAEEGCVGLYVVDGRRYLWLTRWEKHRGKGKRGSCSKFPEPPRGSAGIRGDPSEKRETRSEKRETGGVGGGSPEGGSTGKPGEPDTHGDQAAKPKAKSPKRAKPKLAMAKAWPEPADRQKIEAWFQRKSRDPREVDRYLAAFRQKCGGGESLYRNWGRAFLDHVRNGWLESRLEHKRGPGGKRYSGSMAEGDLDQAILDVHHEKHSVATPALGCPHCEEVHGGPIPPP